MSPSRKVFTLASSLSTQVTWWPISAKQTAATSPTYPEPIMHMETGFGMCSVFSQAFWSVESGEGNARSVATEQANRTMTGFRSQDVIRTATADCFHTREATDRLPKTRDWTYQTDGNSGFPRAVPACTG